MGPPQADPTAVAAPAPGAELAARRDRIVHALLTTAVPLGIVALVPSLWLCIRQGLWGVVVLDAIVYAALLLMWVAPRRWYDARAGTMVAICFVLGVGITARLGPRGAGLIWIAAGPVLAAVFFGMRETLSMLALMLLAGLAFLLALRTGALHWAGPDGEPLQWVVTLANHFVAAAMLALAVVALIRGLRLSAERADRFGAELAEERLRLIAANERLRAEMREREAAEAQLRQADKLTAIGTLASGIAHDMNNLLTPILASAEILRSELAEGSPHALLLDRTLEATRSGKELVRRILAFSRPSTEGRQPLDAMLAFGDAVRLLRASLPAGVDVRFRAAEEVGAVLLTNAEAHQLLLNFGTNAHRAMPNGGVLSIELDVVRSAEVVGFPDTEAGRAVRLVVRDSGVGMDDATRSRAFEPFFTTSGQGTGIGLATVHGIVSSAGGCVACESGPGQGTVMRVYLPRLEAGAAAPVAQVAEAPPRGRGERILVVDDEPGVCMIAQRVLERGGYRVSGVGEVDSALAALLAPGEHFDLILTDLSMPGRSGLTLAEEVRSAGGTARIVLMTGLADAELRARAAAVGVDRLVAKPFEGRELLLAVAGALQDRPDTGAARLAHAAAAR